jgi:hypothetical protein
MTIEQMNVLQLKKLCAKIIGGTATADDIEGTTIAEVLKVIIDNYTGATPQTLGVLTVTSVEGSSKGTTKVTVTPTVGENSTYRYTVLKGGNYSNISIA